MAMFKRKGKWVVQWSEGSKVRTQTVGRDKTAAERLLNKKKENAVLRRHGVIDIEAEKIAAAEAKSLADHLADFEAYHKSKGSTAKQTGQVMARLRRVLNGGGVNKLSDLTENNVRAGIKHLQEAGYLLNQTHRTYSNESLNQHMKAAKQFARWLADDNRVKSNRLVKLEMFNVAVDRRHDRRALTDQEIAKLLAPENLYQDKTCPSAISPADRAMLYRVALATGFRAGELASLTPASFDGKSMTVEAGFSKRRRRDTQPIDDATAEAIAKWVTGRPANAPMFDMPQNMAKVFRRDLAKAGITYVVDGKYADFHSLRHTFITRLVAANLPPKIAQTLARHSTITLTMDRYTHLNRDDLGHQLAKVPPLPSAVPVLRIEGNLGEDKAITVQTREQDGNWFARGGIATNTNKDGHSKQLKATRPSGLEPETVRLEGVRSTSGTHSPSKTYKRSPKRRCARAAKRGQKGSGK
jgi:integrase/recombinase XerD